MTPSTSGSPMTPNFFFMPSASMFSFSKPGIMSSALPMTRAKGTKLWQKGCGMRDALPLGIILLKLVGSQVGHHQGDDVAHDGSKIAPCQRLWSITK